MKRAGEGTLIPKDPVPSPSLSKAFRRRGQQRGVQPAARRAFPAEIPRGVHGTRDFCVAETDSRRASPRRSERPSEDAGIRKRQAIPSYWSYTCSQRRPAAVLDTDHWVGAFSQGHSTRHKSAVRPSRPARNQVGFFVLAVGTGKHFQKFVLFNHKNGSSSDLSSVRERPEKKKQ